MTTSVLLYLAARRTKPSGTTPYRAGGDTGYGFQVWDWFKLPNGADAYNIQMFVLQPQSSADGAAPSAASSQGDLWSAVRHKGVYRALVRDDIVRLLGECGYERIEWMLPASTGFYQPCIAARRPLDVIAMPTATPLA